MPMPLKTFAIPCSIYEKNRIFVENEVYQITHTFSAFLAFYLLVDEILENLQRIRVQLTLKPIYKYNPCLAKNLMMDRIILCIDTL